MRRLLITLIVLPVLAWADYVRVDKTANVYSEPNSDSTVLQRLDPDNSDKPIYLPVVSGELQNGYHHIRVGQGTGWVYKARVRLFAGNPPSVGRVNVYGGNPKTAEPVTEIENTAYVVGYSEAKANPLWVAYRLGTDQGHQCERLTRFRTDARSQAAITHNDYNNSGYDRGHMAPSSNVGSRYGCAAQDETYFMTNIVPQLPSLNQRPWGALENLEAEYPKDFQQVWIITGPIFNPEWIERLCSGVEVPMAFYKIIVRENNGATDVLATIFDQGTKPGSRLATLVTTVDEIERRTGIDFLTELPDTAEDVIESSKATHVAWRLDTKLDTSFPGLPREKCMLPRVKRGSVGPDQ